MTNEPSFTRGHTSSHRCETWIQGRMVSGRSVCRSSSRRATQMFSPSLKRSKKSQARPSSSRKSVLSMHFSPSIIGFFTFWRKGPSGESAVATQICSSAVKYMYQVPFASYTSGAQNQWSPHTSSRWSARPRRSQERRFREV